MNYGIHVDIISTHIKIVFVLQFENTAEWQNCTSLQDPPGPPPRGNPLKHPKR